MSGRYTFCESTEPSTHPVLHIRHVTNMGQKGIAALDTPALCRTKVIRDRPAEITFHALQGCCPTCAKAYTNETAR